LVASNVGFPTEAIVVARRGLQIKAVGHEAVGKKPDLIYASIALPKEKR
jgi:hypothetical protein